MITNEFVDAHFPHCPFCNKYTDKASTCEGCKYQRGVEGQTLDKFDPNEIWKEMMERDFLKQKEAKDDAGTNAGTHRQVRARD